MQGKVHPWNNSWWLVADAALESSGAPINKLDNAPCLDGGYSYIHALGHHITSVHQAAGHVPDMAWVTFGYHSHSWDFGAAALQFRHLTWTCSADCAESEMMQWRRSMAEAFRRRRHSRIAWLALSLPQTLQSQIPTVFIFTTYFPQNSHKHLLRRLTFIFSI